MKNELNKKYGLPTAIAMVVGIVVGSGVFFKAEAILNKTGGNLKIGIAAWLAGGIIMIVCAYVFSLMANKYEYVNGVVDYAEVCVGKKYGYYLGWFMTIMYYPSLTAALSWLTARYTCVLFGMEGDTGLWALAGTYLIISYAINALSPVLAGKVQVSATVLKCIPLVLMGVVGTIVGLINGTTIANFTTVVSASAVESPFLSALCATAFAYEGWVIATSINAELKDSKKNLPKALVLGTILVVAIYILYYIGLAGAVSNETMMAGGQAGVKLAFETIFTKAGGTVIFAFVIVSCFGTLNGLMLGCCRGIYSLASRNLGPKAEVFKQVDEKTNMPTNSSIFGLLLCGFWLTYLYGGMLGNGWFGPIAFDPTELPIIALYAAYIPIFIKFMIMAKDLNAFKRFVAPSFAVLGCLFMVYSCYAGHGITNVLWFLAVFAVVILFGAMYSEVPEAPKVKNATKAKKKHK